MDDLNYRSPTQDVSEQENSSVWPKDYSHDILAKNVTAFCFCLRNLLQTKLKSFGLLVLTEKSEQPSTDSVCWLLVFTPMQIYNEEVQAEQGKTKNVQFEGRGEPQKMEQR